MECELRSGVVFVSFGPHELQTDYEDDAVLIGMMVEYAVYIRWNIATVRYVCSDRHLSTI